MSLYPARIVPADRRFVLLPSLGYVCISMYCFSDVVRLALVMCINVGLIGVLTIRWRCRIVLCMPLVLNDTTFMAVCL